MKIKEERVRENLGEFNTETKIVKSFLREQLLLKFNDLGFQFKS